MKCGWGTRKSETVQGMMVLHSQPANSYVRLCGASGVWGTRRKGAPRRNVRVSDEANRAQEPHPGTRGNFKSKKQKQIPHRRRHESPTVRFGMTLWFFDQV
jgi:hypothetical protein